MKSCLLLGHSESFGVQLEVFYSYGISVVLSYTLGFSRCHNEFLSSSAL